MKAVIYVRVSSKEQVDGTSLETQERICKDFALRNNLEVDRVFVEKGESAKTADRTELKALLDYIGKNHKNISSVLVYKVDRLARNTLDHATLKLFFNKFGIKLTSATENLEDTPLGRLIENQLAGFAQFDNEIRTERSTNGMIEAVKNGRYVWLAPKGYLNTGGKQASNLTLGDAKTVSLIRKFWEYVDTGYDIETARKLIYKEGLTISKSQAHRMLRNKVYMGVIERFGLSIVGHFQPIIKPELFNRVLEKLDNRKKKMPLYRVLNPDFPVRGLLKCDTCETELTASWSTGNGGRYGYYRCKSCKNINYKKTDVEEAFINFLKAFAYKSHLKTIMLKAIEANLEYRNENNKKRVDKNEKEVIRQKAKIRLITEKNFKGVISDNLAKEMILEAEQAITALTLDTDAYKVDKDEILKIAEKSLSVLEDISGIWAGIDIEIKVRFQKFLFPDGLYYNGTKFRTTKLAYCIEPNTTKELQQFHLATLEGVEPPTWCLERTRSIH